MENGKGVDSFGISTKAIYVETFWKRCILIFVTAQVLKTNPQ